MSHLGFFENLLDGAEVDWRPLGEVCNVLRGKRLTKDKLSDEFTIPVFHGGLEPLGFFDQSNRPGNSTMIINVGASAGTVGYSNKEFWSSDGCYCISHSEILDSKFLFHYLRNVEHQIIGKVRYAGIPTLDAIVVERLLVPIPCPEEPEKSLAIQGEIVRILDSFTELTAELTAELEARKKQYKHYRDQLLTFAGLDVPWNKLVDVADFRRGTAITKKETTDGDVPVVANGPIPSYSHGEHNREGETVVVARSGAYAGYVSYWDRPIFLTDAFSVHPYPETMRPKFIYHLLQNKQAQLHAMKKGAGVPHVRVKEMEQYDVPVPSMEAQDRIVAILDKFDTLTTSFSEGLPREIALRQKQYDYYRDLLLSFPKPVKAAEA